MGEYLPGSLQERLKELREAHGYSAKKDLAEALEIDPATYGRIESSKTKTINSDLLIKLAKLYNVSTDYILGISDVPERTYYDIGELGLSVNSAKNLFLKNANSMVIDKLLQNDKFLQATREIGSYFSNVPNVASIAGNRLYDSAFDFTSELITRRKIPLDKDVRALRKDLKSHKIPAESYQLSRIQTLLMTAVKETKKETEKEVTPFIDEKITSEIIANFMEELKKYGDLSELSHEDRMSQFIEILKTVVKKDSNYSEEMNRSIDHTIEKIFPNLVKIWEPYLQKQIEKTKEI